MSKIEEDVKRITEQVMTCAHNSPDALLPHVAIGAFGLIAIGTLCLERIALALEMLVISQESKDGR